MTIGFFDGVHLGHLALLKRLKELSPSLILTFSNHPQSLFHPPGPPVLLPLEKKLLLLSHFADEVMVVAFTQEFANTPFDQLLDRFELSHLILGKGAVFGSNREGNEENVKHYAQKKGIIVEYIPKVLWNHEPISSSRIRKAMQEGDFTVVDQLLGRI